MASRAPRRAVGINTKSSATHATTIGGCETSVAPSCAVVAHRGLEKIAGLRLGFQRDPRSGGVTR
ncbi:hypothetical protein GBA52_010977 [Prunus armeniaca]|nr:hypothetical protein GBA52_010977 [Prunus armeniaca]